MTANVVTRDNFSRVYTDEARERFWTQVDRVLRDVFAIPQVDAERTVRQYRRSLDDAPVGEQIFAYHDNPLNVAADLAGIGSITEEQQQLYRQIDSASEPFEHGNPDDAG